MKTTYAPSCGDSLHRVVPNEKVFAYMKKRADSMPCNDVVVYCTSCTKAMAIGGKTPHYLVDLLLGMETNPGNTDPDVWHKQLDEYIEIQSALGNSFMHIVSIFFC